MPFIMIQGSFHLVGRTQAGNPTGFQPDGDFIQFKLTNLWVPRISSAALTCCFAPVADVGDDRQPWRR
jgi:hypothetical protein